MYDVVALGELIIDFATKSVDTAGYPTLAANPGGAPTNFLAALASFGCRTALIGKIGSDAFGRALSATMKLCGIDTIGLIMDDSVFTTLSFVTFDGQGDREFSFARKPGADMMLREDEINWSLIENTKVFHFGTLSLTDEPARSATVKAVEYAREKNVLVSYDPNLRKPLWKDLNEAKEQILWGLTKADVVKISDNEVEFLWGISPEKGLEKMLNEYKVRLAYVTCGADGCVWGNQNCRGKTESLKDAAVVDTTGAGDIFGGSAMAGLLKTGKMPEALTESELRDITAFACTAAGISTENFGGISSVPDFDAVLARMNRGK